MSIKIQMQDGQGNIIHPQTKAELVQYKDGDANSTLQALEDREQLFISDSEPDKDGFWIDTTDIVSDENGIDENPIAKQIKKYINDNVVVKVDDAVEVIDKVKEDIIASNFEHINTEEAITPIQNAINGFSHNMKIQGKTLQNVKGDYILNTSAASMDDKGIITINFNGTTYYNMFTNLSNMIVKENTQYTAILKILEKTNSDQVDIFCGNTFGDTTPNVSSDAELENATIKTCTIERELQVGEYKFLLETREDFSECKIGDRTFIASKATTGTMKIQFYIIEGDWTNKEVPNGFIGLCSVGEEGYIKLAAVGDDEESTQIIYTDSLRAIGDVKDELDVDRGIITRRIGKIVLNGSETWHRFNDSDNGVAGDKWYFYTKKFNCSLTENALIDKLLLIKNVFLVNSSLYIDKGLQEIGIRNYDYTTVEGLTAWLKANPITILYKLETPIEEKINTSPLRLFDAVNNLVLLNNIKPRVEFDYPTNLKAQINSNTKTLDSLAKRYTVPSNPNLLINGDFSVWNKINNEVTATAKIETANRWFLSFFGTGSLPYSAKIKKENGGIYVENTQSGGQNMFIEQPLNSLDYKKLESKNVTISAKYSNLENGEVSIGFKINGNYTQYMKEDRITESTGILSYTITVPNDLTEFRPYVFMTGSNGAKIIINYIKLELGSIATPFIPKTYVQELQDCLMYNNDKVQTPYSNPNILINGNFINPINQRGKTVYDTNGYSIDRWILWNANTTLTLNNGYCTLAGDYNCLVQHIEFPTHYSNKEVTLSAKVKGSGGGIRISIYSVELDGWVATEVIDTTDWKEVSVSCVIPTLTNDSQRLSVTVEGAGASSIDIEWVKLEYGSIATPFVPRLYGEELALCQRYYEKDRHTVRGIVGGDSLRIETDINYKVTKRIIPTVTLYGLNNEKNAVYSVGSHVSLRAGIYSSNIDGFGCIDVFAKDNSFTVHPNLVCEFFGWEAEAEIY